MFLLCNIFTSLALAGVITFTTLMPPACMVQKSVVEAAIQDVIDTLNVEEARIIADFPSLAPKYAKLKATAISIKAALVASDTLTVKDLIKAFFPLFDEIVAKLGVNRKILDLVDIGIHIILNHLPLNAATVGAMDGPASVDSLLLEYKSRVVWGCENKHDKCKQLK